MLVPQLGYRVAEVNFDPSLVNQRPIHFTVCENTSILSIILNKRILQRVISFPISDHITLQHFAKSWEYNLEVVRLSHGVQLAHKKYIFGGLDVSLGQVIENF